MKCHYGLHFSSTLVVMVVLSWVVGFFWHFTILNAYVPEPEPGTVVRPLMIIVVIWLPFVLAPVFASLTIKIRTTLFDERVDPDLWQNAAHQILFTGIAVGLIFQPLLKVDPFGASYSAHAVLVLLSTLPMLNAGLCYALVFGLRSNGPLAGNAYTDAHMIRTSPAMIAYHKLAEEAGRARLEQSLTGSRKSTHRLSRAQSASGQKEALLQRTR